MKWAYSELYHKAHCFVPTNRPDLYLSLCDKVVTFQPGEINERLDEHVNFCFSCLLAYIKKGGFKT